jgi:hypothetical protein
LVGGVDGEVRPAFADDLALFAQRARDDLYLRPARDVVRDRRARRQGLVIGMRMHEEQPRGLHSHQHARCLA